MGGELMSRSTWIYRDGDGDGDMTPRHRTLLPEGAPAGFDFGTSTSVLAERAAELPRTVRLGDIDPWMPSEAWFDRTSGRFVVGEEAARRIPAALLIKSVKKHVTWGADKLALTADDGSLLEVKVADVVRSLLAEVTDRIRARSPQTLETDALYLGCPAMWDGDQRRLLVELARDVGLPTEVDRMLDEPIAAGIYWIWREENSGRGLPSGNVLVIDYGGGTLDVALLAVEGDLSQINVLAAEATDGAGDALDEIIFRGLRTDLEQQEALTDLDDFASVEALLRIRARELKHYLSDEAGGPSRTVLVGGGFDLPALNYDRDRLEEDFQSGLRRVDHIVEWVLRSAELRKRRGANDHPRSVPLDELKADVKHVLLVGGMSHIPVLSHHLREAFPSANVERLPDPQEAVAAGLTLSTLFDDLNLHRPAFNVVAVYRRGDREVKKETLYQAFSPLYTAGQVLRGMTELGHRAQLSYPPDCHGRVDVGLRFESLGGKPLDLSTEGSPWVHLDRGVNGGSFKLYTDGRVSFRGTGGSEVNLRLDRWPVIRSNRYVVPISQIENTGFSNDQVGHWWGERP